MNPKALIHPDTLQGAGKDAGRLGSKFTSLPPMDPRSDHLITKLLRPIAHPPTAMTNLAFAGDFITA
jgi:hypothetical protein